METEPNPYAPPRERRASRKKRRRGEKPAPGEWVKWAYAASAGTTAVAFFAIFLGVGAGGPLQRDLIWLVDGPLRWTSLALGIVWIYCAWSGLPRLVNGGITGVGAVVRFVVPIYSIYWLFGVNLQLCTGLDIVLAQHEDRRRAPKALAMGATVVHLVPLVVMLTDAKAYTFLVMIASSALWFAYMFQCDPLRRAVMNAPDDL